MSKVTAVILAGAKADFGEDTTISRAMIPLGGDTMIGHITKALKASPSVGKIIAVGDVADGNIDEIISPGDSLFANLLKGAEAVPEGDILILTCDIPLITSEGAEHFLAEAAGKGFDFAVPIISKEDCMAKYTQFKRTYLRIAEGTFTLGNIMMISKDFITNRRKTIEDTYNARKNPVKLARVLGFNVLARLILGAVFPGLLKTASLENMFGKMLGAKVKAVVSPYAEIGEDIDKQSDLDAVRAVFAERGK
ncbi:MAG: nucleotidyltransferase family protein [Abditibacteriota bacterium]|nr:nucleotidyltransferase family protein [Abditibacteriota bacterium]